MFDQEGKITQIQYAVEAMNQAGPALGLLFKDGIVLGTERETSKTLLETSRHSEKIFKLDSHLYCVVSGMTADANYLIEFIRGFAQQYRYTYRAPMPIDQIVERVCNLKQSYTQFGGKRPFGTSFIYCGWDEINGHQILTSDPAGVFSGWKANAQGLNNQMTNNHLKQEWKADMSEKEALELALATIVKTMDTVDPNPERLELVVVKRKADTETVEYKKVSIEEVTALLAEKKKRDELEAAKKEKK